MRPGISRWRHLGYDDFPMQTTFHWIDSAPEIEKMAKALREATRVGVDTEFIRETTFFPKIALIQLSTLSQVWLVDPTVLDAKALSPLLELLAEGPIIKVMHAAHGDQECFFHAYGKVLEPVFDTAIAAAMCGHGDNVGLSRLVKSILGHSLSKGRARAHWLSRPLAPELKRYAAEDVRFLVPLAETLRKETDRLGRTDWALEMSRPRPEIANDSPESVAQRTLAGHGFEGMVAGALYELVIWRETRARAADRPRGWIADNSILVALARSHPKTIDELSHFRGLSPKEASRSGKDILKAIEKGCAHPIPAGAQVPQPSPDEEQALMLLKAFINVLASRHLVASRFLVGAEQILPLYRAREFGQNHWEAAGIIHPCALKMAGRELEDFLAGRSALGLEKGKLSLIERGADIARR